MKALILNSGLGSRIREFTADKPKCLVEISEKENILGRQLKFLKSVGIKEVVITTGVYENDIINYCNELKLNLKYIFVKNPLSDRTNYIYSIYLAKEFLNDSIIMVHGDLVFDYKLLEGMVNCKDSVVAISTTNQLPKKDFKAVVKNGKIDRIGVGFFESAVECQPLYKLNKQELDMWLESISLFCENNNVKCYAENALNVISDKCNIYPMDFKDKLCAEVDTIEDLQRIKERLELKED